MPYVEWRQWVADSASEAESFLPPVLEVEVLYVEWGQWVNDTASEAVSFLLALPEGG